jgi:hypothetical protein
MKAAASQSLGKQIGSALWLWELRDRSSSAESSGNGTITQQLRSLMRWHVRYG